ncbi:hypothetical protein SLEP1_g44362 [Rubroshorea leprosula]|uniref:Uncharacterized protein n=1 Tax=Rubroshorea leprosula TaxID=152421 RepID=A0AAV5LHU5_9ROSI|nr:hypothetical protein SLEP1_g44362 [Rubroshorea leprosula]
MMQKFRLKERKAYGLPFHFIDIEGWKYVISFLVSIKSCLWLRQAWGSHVDLCDSRLLVLMASESQLLQSEYEDYVAVNSGSLACLRAVALILLIILLVHQFLLVTRDSSMVQESSAFYNMSS